MVKQKHFTPLWTLAVFTALSSFTGLTPRNFAQTNPLAPANPLTPVNPLAPTATPAPLTPSIEFLPDLSDGGREPQREGSGSHGGCEIATQPDGRLTALVPMRDVWGKTLDGHPTFWVYVPYQVKPGAEALLTIALRNTEGNIIYQRTVIANRPGIFSFRLPENEPELELDRLYNWIVIFSCGVEFTAEGSVKRVAPPAGLQQDLQSATTPTIQAATYAKYGIWYEALTLLGDRRRQTPNNTQLNSAWAALLNDEHVKLSHVANQAIVDCCNRTE